MTLKQMIIVGKDHPLYKLVWDMYDEVKANRKIDKDIAELTIRVLPAQVNVYIDFVPDVTP